METLEKEIDTNLFKEIMDEKYENPETARNMRYTLFTSLRWAGIDVHSSSKDSTLLAFFKNLEVIGNKKRRVVYKKPRGEDTTPRGIGEKYRQTIKEYLERKELL